MNIDDKKSVSNNEPSSPVEDGSYYVKMPKKRSDSPWAVIGIVLGVCAILFSWIPLFGAITLFVSIPGIFFGIATWISAKNNSVEKSIAMPVVATLINLFAILIVMSINGGIAYFFKQIYDDSPIKYDVNTGSINIKNDSLNLQLNGGDDDNQQAKKIFGLDVESIDFNVLPATESDLEVNPDAEILNWEISFSHMDSMLTMADIKVGFYDSTGALVHEANLWKQSAPYSELNKFTQSEVLDKMIAQNIKDMSYTITNSKNSE